MKFFEWVYPNAHTNVIDVSMGFKWAILDASDTNDPRKAVPNMNYVRMGIRMTPCEYSEP